MRYHWGQTATKKGTLPLLNSADQAKKQSNFDSGSSGSVLLLNLVNLRDLFGFHCYKQNIVFVNRMDQNMAKYRIGIWIKKWWVSPFVWMIDVVLQVVWILYRINKDEGDESLPLLVIRRDTVNAIFLKYSKEGR